MYLLFLSFVIAVSAQQQADVLTCQSHEDYMHFLYKVCSQTIHCKVLFNLYPLEESDMQRISETPEREAFVDYRNTRDFQLFAQQLTASPIFRIQSQTDHLLLENTMPDEWLPTTSVLFKEDVDACSDDMSTHHRYRVISALYAMTIYKMQIADDFFCPDPNERLLVNPVTNRTYCHCKTDKSCANASNFDQLIYFLMVTLIFGIVAACIATFASIFYKQAILDTITRSSI